MELRTTDSACSFKSAVKESEKSTVYEFVDNVSVQSGNLEHFNSVESLRTRTSTESYETVRALCFCSLLSVHLPAISENRHAFKN